MLNVSNIPFLADLEQRKDVILRVFMVTDGATLNQEQLTSAPAINRTDYVGYLSCFGLDHHHKGEESVAFGSSFDISDALRAQSTKVIPKVLRFYLVPVSTETGALDGSVFTTLGDVEFDVSFGVPT